MESVVLEDACGVSKVTKMPSRRVLQLARKGQMPCYRAGRQVRFHVPEVLAWMRQQAADRTAAP